MSKNKDYGHWVATVAVLVGIASYGFTIIATILKKIGIIHLSWWWITAPIWIPFGIIVILICFWLVLLYWMEKANDDLNKMTEEFEGLGRPSAAAQAIDFQRALLHSLEAHGEAVTTIEMISQHFGHLAFFIGWAKRNNLVVSEETPHRYALTRPKASNE